MTPRLAQHLAAYNHWQNETIYEAATALTDAARKLDRAAFFRSIHETLDHIVWADQIWLSRFGGCAAPGGSISSSTAIHSDWGALRDQRRKVDRALIDWADGLRPSDLEGDLTWFSGAANREVCRPKPVLVAHMFNHQTHHRGQVHAMLTAAGLKGPVSDMFLSPQFD